MVDEIAMSAAQHAAAAGVLARFDFSSLLAGAAHLRPHEPAIGDAGAPRRDLSFAELDRRVTALAQAWRELGLQSGERILISAPASSIASIAVLAAARAGLDAALAPLHLARADLACFARSVGAVALAGEPCAGDLAPVDALFAVAAEAADVRLVCALGSQAIDGAVSLDPQSLPFDPEFAPAGGARGAILTHDREGRIGYHSQQALIAAALDLAARARIGADRPILSTLAPMSFAGIVAGPLLALLTGARLVCAGTFDAKTFVGAIEAAQPHLVAPAAATQMLCEAGLIDRDRIASLIALTRFDGADRHVEQRAPALSAGPRLPRIIDYYACDECAAIAEPRGDDAMAQAPAADDHVIHLDERAILAVGRSEGGNGFIGAAVSAASEANP
jgi:acyl-CoA synthetase (AMP-forming)/AMP-acid ligase II